MCWFCDYVVCLDPSILLEVGAFVGPLRLSLGRHMSMCLCCMGHLDTRWWLSTYPSDVKRPYQDK